MMLIHFLQSDPPSTQGFSVDFSPEENASPEQINEQLSSPESPVSPCQEEEEKEDEEDEEEEEVLTLAQEQDDSGETAEEESDSSGLLADQSSMLTNGELSEEEELLPSAGRSLLPSSVLDQASVIAERFAVSMSRRSSLVSEELGPVACPSPPADVFQSPSACMDLPVSSTPEVVSTPEPVAEAPAEAELRSTLSKRDRLLIHKIRRYYEHAEHQDVNFSIKRRESLSYIPAGLVRHLSRQLSSAPQGHPAPVYRKGPSRPTSWSVFDLPGLDKSRGSSETAVLQRSQSETKGESESSVSEERFLEEQQDSDHIAKDDQDDGRTEVTQDGESLESDASPTPSPTATSPTATSPPCQDSPKTPPGLRRYHFNRSHLPKIIHFRTSADEDHILDDVGRMKNKVFQLARQYSQRIKNNRPMVWQRNREAISQQSLKTMPVVQEEKLGKTH